jgi:hypothetical protein
VEAAAADAILLAKAEQSNGDGHSRKIAFEPQGFEDLPANENECSATFMNSLASIKVQNMPRFTKDKNKLGQQPVVRSGVECLKENRSQLTTNNADVLETSMLCP